MLQVLLKTICPLKHYLPVGGQFGKLRPIFTPCNFSSFLTVIDKEAFCREGQCAKMDCSRDPASQVAKPFLSTDWSIKVSPNA